MGEATRASRPSFEWPRPSRPLGRRFDDIGALIVAIIVIVWRIILLVLSIPSIVASPHVGGGSW